MPLCGLVSEKCNKKYDFFLYKGYLENKTKVHRNKISGYRYEWMG